MDLIEATAGPRHPWEKSRASFFKRVLRQALGRSGPVDILDCGAGDAFFSSGLHDVIEVRSLTCWDANYDESTIAKLATQYPDVTFTRTMPGRRYDLVLMLDVIEHVEDDASFVANIVENCVAKDGHVLVSVPAWQALYSRHDEFLRHYRRYAPGDCDRVLTGAGLRIVERGGAFHGLVPARAAQLLRERLESSLRGQKESLREPSSTWNAGPLLTGVVTSALWFDNALSHVARRARVNIPGLSYWALAQP
ncbi:MAG TPA: methyltransferase domain-containing protein [Labilithrix sp.]|nr:methyltransferase domain-containing protein [Labilithrix sp.]